MPAIKRRGREGGEGAGAAGREPGGIRESPRLSPLRQRQHPRPLLPLPTPPGFEGGKGGMGERGGLWDRHLPRPPSHHLPHLKGTKLMAAFGQPLDPLPCGPFLIIHVLPVPHPQRQTLEQRPLAALTNVNVHVEVHMCVKICANICVQISANFCIIRVQIFAHFCIVYLQPYMCISTELLQMRLHLYVTSYLTKCDGSLPPLLQIWGPNCPSTSGSSA